MKHALLASALFLGGAVLLGPLADTIDLPNGVAEIIRNLETIF